MNEQAHAPESTALERAPESEPIHLAERSAMNLFGATSAVAVVERATDVSNALAKVIEEKKLYKMISGKKHVLVEGWTLLGSMLGVFPHTVWTRRIAAEDGGGWEARVEAITRDGDVVSAAESMCSRSESRWAKADDYAIRSMAATRSTAKALRLALGFVISLAGFEATPADEMVEPTPPPEPEYATPEQVAEITALAPDAGVTIETILKGWKRDTLESLTLAEAELTLRSLRERAAVKPQADGSVATALGPDPGAGEPGPVAVGDVAPGPGQSELLPLEPPVAEPGATAEQLAEIRSLAQAANVGEDEICSGNQVGTLEELKPSQALKVLGQLRSLVSMRMDAPAEK